MKRKIAAIVAADIADYSRLVAQDEEETIRRLADHRAVFDDLIKQYKGRIFNTAGDAVLSEFESVVEAVRAAVDIQESLRTRNLDLPPERKLQFRMGISIGDVIERDGDLLGDGVNIAARLESLAVPGGICVSRSVHEAVANKISVPFRYLGEQRVKNLPRPIDAFQVTLAGSVDLEAAKERKRSAGKRKLIVPILLAAIVIGAVFAAARLTMPGVDQPRESSAPAGNASGQRSAAKSPPPVSAPASPLPRPPKPESAPTPETAKPAAPPTPQIAVGRTKVTFNEWNQCLADGDCKNKPDSQGFGEGERPVINVSWTDAKEYVAWLSKKTGKRYRLPSEAEWEYAAHGGTKTAFAWGKAVERQKANCTDCESGGGVGTFPVKSFPPNGYGLYDMAGNAAEWVEDCWNPSYAGAPENGSAWVSGNCGQRVLRGGSFDSSAAYVQPTARFRYDADVRYWGNGLRVVRELP